MNDAASASPLHVGELPPVVPAPWTLTGNGVLLLFRGRAAAMPAISALALIEYAGSDVGGYGELISGHWPVRVGDRSGLSVEQIWVDSAASMVGGRANWGLGKELAEIRRDPARRDWHVADADGRLIALTHRPWGPVLPAWKPGGVAALLQPWEGQRYETRFTMRSTMRPTRIGRLAVDRRLLDLRERTLVAALEVRNFAMRFPVARID